jgi:hypothetical protein
MIFRGGLGFPRILHIADCDIPVATPSLFAPSTYHTEKVTAASRCSIQSVWIMFIHKAVVM